jgi:pyruvate,orthophosphate dikinase
MKGVLGGKGANLAEMTRLGIPVPPGFTIATSLCNDYVRTGEFPDGLDDDIRAAVHQLEELTNRTFGGTEHPLLLSVRSGSKFSMPGMMDTILDLGLNDATAEGLAMESGNARFAYDSYRRFVQMYGNVVHDIKSRTGDPFEEALHSVREARGVARDIDLGEDDLRSIVATFKTIFADETGQAFPDDPWAQLRGAVEAVFRSWNSRRATDYRRVHHIPDDLGTAVNVMAMVYGNVSEDSGTGVAFTRNPSNGTPGVFGEFLMNAQGEDVVAGIRDPEPIAAMADELPQAYVEFEEVCRTLERHYHDMQDVEFTVERGKLYILQTRRGKRTAAAAVRIAVDLVEEGLIDEAQAVRLVEPDQLNQLLHPTIAPDADVAVIAKGLPASPGAAVGKAVFDADRAEEMARDGEAVVLVRRETSPDDFHGMVAAKGILTARGGMTSHAAVVARGMGKCCVAGAKEVDVDEAARQFSVNGTTVCEGDWVTLDGTLGRVIEGRTPLVEPTPGPEFERIMEWADEHRRLRVRTNADTPNDAERGRAFGAEGIGLCRTEHMFFEGDRIMAMREMILADTLDERRAALAKLLPMQREDFAGIFRAMDGYPVTIRLLDPPLHEFLPHDEGEIREVAEHLGVDERKLRRALESRAEANPMLGHRGCRLGMTYPEITEMQARAIFEAACDVSADGVEVHPEVMVPLVGHVEELSRQREIVRRIAREVFKERRRAVDYLVGTMIEVPRACATANEIATVAEFFSFGTNDLTQTTFGISRDDAGRFLPQYVESGILPDDPFQTIDQKGVGALMLVGIEGGRTAKPNLKIGICGEHGGDPRSVRFCHRAALNYVSCSPFRVPIARLAAAQAALEDNS